MAPQDEKTIIAEPINLTIINGPASGKRACFIQYSGSRVGKRYILDEPEMVVGRLEESAIVINDANVSRRHAKVVQKGTGIEVEDMSSANGTFVNEKRITSVTLKHNDMVRFGTIVFKFFADGSSEGAFVDNIYKKATIDATTGIYNKQYLIDELDSNFKVSRNYQRNLALIIFDLDFFKKVNDVHGHNAGDYVLKQCSQLAKSCVRKNDVLARFGGEEFVVILPDTDIRAGIEMAERIRQKIEGHVFDFEQKQLRQTVSAGVSQLSSSMKTPNDLVEDADQKLYQSKHSGRNKVTA